MDDELARAKEALESAEAAESESAAGRGFENLARGLGRALSANDDVAAPGGVRASAMRRSVVFARVSRVFTDDDGVVIVVVIDREGRRETRARRSVARVRDDPAREAR